MVMVTFLISWECKNFSMDNGLKLHKHFAIIDLPLYIFGQANLYCALVTNHSFHCNLSK